MSDILTKNDSPVNALLWTREEEELLKDWSFVSNKFRWLHERSSLVFKTMNNKIALPVIIISTLTGTANFGLNSLVPAEFIQTAQVIIGGANIFCGILTTIQTYFKYAENAEAHANAAKLWSKFQSIIAIELAIEPSKRKNPTVFLKFCIEEYNKLKEYSPQIPPEIASLFKSTFRRKNITLPDIYDEITPVITYSDYVIRNVRKERDDISVPKTPKHNDSSTIDNKVDDVEIGLQRYPSAYNHKPVKEIVNKFRQNVRDIDDESGISIERNVKSVEKYTANQKDNIKNELEHIRPNVQGLISSLSRNIGNSLSSRVNQIKTNVTTNINNVASSIPDPNDISADSTPPEKPPIIIDQSNNEQSKNNLKTI